VRFKPEIQTTAFGCGPTATACFGGGLSHRQLPITATAMFGSAGGSQVQQQQVMSTAAAPAPPPKLEMPKSEARQQILATIFTPPHKWTIPSDGVSHRVVIGEAEIDTRLHHHCVPRRDTSVYLIAKALNTSPHPLLKGPVSVYLNGSQNAKEEFKSVVNQGERFEMARGVDDSVWAEQKPVGEYLQHTGYISKPSISNQEQRLLVKNTKVAEEVRLTIHERVPKSTDAEIKVKVHEPTPTATV